MRWRPPAPGFDSDHWRTKTVKVRAESLELWEASTSGSMSSSNASAKAIADANGSLKEMNGSAEDGSDASSESTSGRVSGGAPAPLSITSDEVNFLVYRYLQESGTFRPYYCPYLIDILG